MTAFSGDLDAKVHVFGNIFQIHVQLVIDTFRYKIKYFRCLGEIHIIQNWALRALWALWVICYYSVKLLLFCQTVIYLSNCYFFLTDTIPTYKSVINLSNCLYSSKLIFKLLCLQQTVIYLSNCLFSCRFSPMI